MGLLRDLPLTDGDLAKLDAALFVGVHTYSHYLILNYLEATHRSRWETVEPFVVDGLNRGGAATKKFATLLRYLKPPKQFVRGVLDSHRLSESTRVHLRKHFKLD